jgi:hypothetical protein
VNTIPQLAANGAAVLSILIVLFASPLILGSYVVVQRGGVIIHLVWFGGLLVLLAGALAMGILGLLLLGW